MPVNMTINLFSLCSARQIGGSTYQCKNHGPVLSVTKRKVTFESVNPVLTVSLRTGFSKLYVELSALLITENACYRRRLEHYFSRKMGHDVRHEDGKDAVVDR
jgi:hypothetical protein